jgi:diguanylate cyclase (GGDEF)-like protein
MFQNPSVWRYLGMLVLILGMLIGGTWVTVKTTTDHLLYQNATRAAQNWAQYLAANVSDLEQIAAGETPSSASLTFFKSARKSGEVFRYTVFNRYGYSILISDRDKITIVDLSDYSAVAASSIKDGRPIVDAKSGHPPDQPAYFAEAYIPVLVDGHPVAIVAAYVDQTAERDSFYRTFLVAAVTLCLLTGFSFVLPALAWYRRTKEKQQADRRIQFLAHHDALTGLANRACLIERLDNALAEVPSSGGHIALYFIDLDHFKDVNDSLGHDGGDYLLSTIAQRLSALTRIEDLVARLGGDEFIVVQIGVSNNEQVEGFARRIASVLSEPMYFKEQEIKANATIGIALAPVDGITSERLLKSADLALYNGKAAGRNRIRFFAPEMDEALQAHLTLEKAIRDAIATDGFVLHYQPVFEVSHNRLMGYEALVRLPAKDGTLIPPDTFIPVAEDLHLIDKIGAWVLREACLTAMAWPEKLTVAVNLSPSQFESGTIVAVVAAVLKETGLEAHRLELEIIETLLLGNKEHTMQQLLALKALGVSIVMDDFGTGYSSLSYLWKFPFDKIKIDRGFMQNFENSSREVETVVKSIIALGRELHMRVTVEGVETKGEADFLYDADGDLVQGFYFGRPIPASEIAANILADFRKTLPTTRPPDKANIKLVKL